MREIVSPAEQVTRVIRPILCGLHRHLIILAHERWLLERFEMVAEQYSKDRLGSALA